MVRVIRVSYVVSRDAKRGSHCQRHMLLSYHRCIVGTVMLSVETSHTCTLGWYNVTFTKRTAIPNATLCPICNGAIELYF